MTQIIEKTEFYLSFYCLPDLLFSGNLLYRLIIQITITYYPSVELLSYFSDGVKNYYIQVTIN